ncbi:MAG: sulfur carrier protein ThiS [Amaricoccus sp.]
MRIVLNGEPREIGARALHDALAELGFAGATIATAVNGRFVPATARMATVLDDGDRVEVLAPRQGG